jgi:hypothetical protein
MGIIYPVEKFVEKLEEITQREEREERKENYHVNLGCIELWDLEDAEAPEFLKLGRAMCQADTEEQIDLLRYLKVLLQCGEREEIQKVLGEPVLEKIEAGAYGSKERLMISYLPHELRVWYDKPAFVSYGHVDSDGKGLLLDIRSSSWIEGSEKPLEHIFEEVIKKMYWSSDPKGYFSSDITLKPLGDCYGESLPVEIKNGQLSIKGSFDTFEMIYARRARRVQHEQQMEELSK